jgi:serine/threonine-protein kinase RsbW
MALLHISDWHSFPSRPEAFVEVHLSLWSAIADISPFVDRLMSLILAGRSVDGSEIDIEMALREALANAIIHGNHADPTKPVEVICRCSADGEVWLTIRDRGAGFDVTAVPDPTAAENRRLTYETCS